MASTKKKNKLKNAFLWRGGLKNKGFKNRCKRLLFYTSSDRRIEKGVSLYDYQEN